MTFLFCYSPFVEIPLSTPVDLFWPQVGPMAAQLKQASRWYLEDHCRYRKSGSTIRTLLHGKINPKDRQVLSLGDVGFLLFFRVVSGDYGKPCKWLGSPPFTSHEWPFAARERITRSPKMDHGLRKCHFLVGMILLSYAQGPSHIWWANEVIGSGNFPPQFLPGKIHV